MRKKSGSDGTSRAPTEIDIAVGKNIRKFRQETGMTLAELAEKLGLSHQQLQKYETGTNRVSAGMIGSLADMLRIPVEDFFSTGEQPKSAAVSAKDKQIETARRKCRILVDRVTSLEKLEQMAKVLKALSSQS